VGREKSPETAGWGREEGGVAWVVRQVFSELNLAGAKLLRPEPREGWVITVLHAAAVAWFVSPSVLFHFVFSNYSPYHSTTVLLNNNWSSSYVLSQFSKYNQI
jgi:hypothetical protein